MDRWAGKVAIVTGASSGIGASIVDKLLDHNIKVVGIARRKERLDALAKKCEGKKGSFHPIQADVTKEEDVLRAFQWTKDNLGPVSILINSAGAMTTGYLSDAKTEDWNQMLQLYVIGLSMATREALKVMKENNIKGHIIHINSIAGHYVVSMEGGCAMYVASKHAVTSVTESLRMELSTSGHKIKVTSLVEPQPELKMVLSMDRWIGKVAIVTGVSSGIGASIVEKLLDNGLKVVGLARRKDRLEALAKKSAGKKGSFHPIQADVTKEEDILKAFKWTKDNLGPVNILINNAGVMIDGSLSEGKTENWNAILQLNVIGLSIATREALKVMKENNIKGHIIHINSIVGHYVYNVEGVSAMYPASKHAVTSLTESLRMELSASGHKIKITSLSPGMVDTELISAELRTTETFKVALENDSILLPEDIADGVIYALSTPPRVQIHELMIRPVGEAF